MATEVTIQIPVTARFDGCFCSPDCEHLDWACVDCTIAKSVGGSDDAYTGNDVGQIAMDLVGPTVYIDKDQGEAYIRTRWCCDHFGMGENQQAEEAISQS